MTKEGPIFRDVNSELSSSLEEVLDSSKYGFLLLCLSDEEINLIQRAADILNLDIEEFILTVALEEANRVIGERGSTAELIK